MDKPAIGRLPRKTEAVLIIFICSCLLSTARIIRFAPRPWRLTPDDVSQRSDQRFAAIKQSLPSRGVVGYVGEAGESFLADYYLAQYALAPLIVDRSIGHKFVVGNFATTQIPSSLPGLRKVQDFGNGVVLLTPQDSH